MTGGTQTPTGGVKTGDMLPNNPGAAPGRIAIPLIVWEGWLGGTTLLRINPSVWEFDGNPTLYVEWSNTMITANGGGPGTDPTLESQLMANLQKAAKSYCQTLSSSQIDGGSACGSSAPATGTTTPQTVSNPSAGTTTQPLQLPPFMLAGQQGWDHFIGDVNIFPPLAFSANGVQAGTKISPTVATVTFKDTPAGLLQRSDAQYTVTVAIFLAP